MTYRTLMVYVEYDGVPEHRVRLAADVADKFSASIIGLSAVAVRPPFVAEGVVIEHVTEAEIADMQAKLATKGDWFRQIAGGDRQIEWRAPLDFPTAALTREARAADLVVIGQTKGWPDAYTLLDAGEAVLKAGRPVLVVPEGAVQLRADHVVIGWKDTREARRAVQDALPFLHQATTVTIAEVCEADEQGLAQQGLEDVARYLGRHGITGIPKVIVRKQGTDASQLVRLAGSEGADLLVAGAYGHSRLGEWIFGGMTQDLLASGPICCLMSH